MERHLVWVLADEEVLEGFLPFVVHFVVVLHLDTLRGSPYHCVRRVQGTVLDPVVISVPLSVIVLRYGENHSSRVCT